MSKNLSFRKIKAQAIKTIISFHQLSYSKKFQTDLKEIRTKVFFESPLHEYFPEGLDFFLQEAKKSFKQNLMTSVAHHWKRLFFALKDEFAEFECFDIKPRKWEEPKFGHASADCLANMYFFTGAFDPEINSFSKKWNIRKWDSCHILAYDIYPIYFFYADQRHESFADQNRIEIKSRRKIVPNRSWWVKRVRDTSKKTLIWKMSGNGFNVAQICDELAKQDIHLTESAVRKSLKRRTNIMDNYSKK